MQLLAKRQRQLYPVVSLLAGASLWGVIWYPMRLLEGGGLSGIWLTLILYGSALAASLPRTWRGASDFARSPGLLVALMLTAGWTNIAFVEAVLAGNILRVLLLFYLAPLWQTFFGWLLLGERPSRLAWASLLLAMSGALVMLFDPRLGLPWPSSAPDWYALSSGLAFAASNVITRKAQQVSLEAKVLAVWSGVTVLTVVIVLGAAVPLPRVSAQTLGGAMALGVLGILVMTALVQYGVTHMPVHRSAVLALIELVAGAVSQQLLTEEVVTAREWAGGALIILGAYISARASSPRDY